MYVRVCVCVYIYISNLYAHTHIIGEGLWQYVSYLNLYVCYIIVTWTVRAVSSPCRAEPTRPEPRQAGPRHARCHTAALGSDVTYTSQLQHAALLWRRINSARIPRHTLRCHGEDCVLDVLCTGYIRTVGQLQQ
jgi:hypothetical protein